MKKAWSIVIALCMFIGNVSYASNGDTGQSTVPSAALYTENDSVKATAAKTSLEVKNDYGDYTYFNNHYCRTGNDAQYINLEPQPKSDKNTIILKRLENYKNPDREDYIYIKKGDADTDCFVNVNLRRFDFTTNTKKVYDYLLVDGKFRKDILGSKDQAFLIKGKNASGNTLNVCPVYITKSGYIVTNPSYVSSQYKITAKKEFQYTMFVNLKEHYVDIYLDGQKIYSKLSINKDMTEITQIRYALAEGTGDTYIDDYSVTGLINPYTNDNMYHTSVFTDDVNEKEFMADKLGFTLNSDFMTVNARKIKDGYESRVKDEKLYINISSINTAFGESFADNGTDAAESSNVKINYNGRVYENGIKTDKTVGVIKDNGEVYLGVEDFAAYKGKQVFKSESGMIIISDYTVNLSRDSGYWCERGESLAFINQRNDLDILYSYLTAYRPSKEELISDYEKNTGDYDVHPKLLLNKNDFDKLRDNYSNDEIYRGFANKVIDTADNLYAQPIASYTWDDSMRTLTTAENLLDKFRYWGYAYQMTGDNKYPERAYKEFEAVAKFPDFNEAHIIDSGEYLTAFAFGYDWLYDGYTAEQRKFILDNFYEKSYLRLASGLYGGLTSRTSGNTGSWIAFRQGTNFNAIVNGGVVCGSIAFMEKDPQYCTKVMSDSLKSLEYFMESLMPDGGDCESLPYWNFAMQYAIYATEGTNKAFGSCYGTDNFKGFNKTLEYAKASIGTNGINNYHDSGAGVANKNIFSYDSFSYLGRKYEDSLACAMRAYDLINNRSMGFFDVLYYDKRAMETYNDVLNNASYTSKISGTEMFSVMQSCNKDNKGLYFSTHFGAVSGYHAHNDAGTFVLDMMGERWADDLGADNYNLQNEEGFSSTQLYRYRAEGHNTFTVNNSEGFNQSENGFAKIEKYEYNDVSAYAVSDMSSVYEDMQNMTVGYYIGDNKNSVKIRSEMISTKDSEIYWFMHTRASAQVKNNIAYLTQNGKNVKVEFLCSDDNASIEIMDAKPLESSNISYYGTENTQYKKIAIKMNVKKGENASLSIKITPDNDEITAIDDTPIAQWELSDGYVHYDLPSEFLKTDGIVLSEVTGLKQWCKNDAAVKVITEEKNGIIFIPISDKKRYTVIKSDVMPVSADVYFSGAESGIWSKMELCVDKESGKANVFINGKRVKTFDNAVKEGYAQVCINGNHEWGYLYLDNTRFCHSDFEVEETSFDSRIYSAKEGMYLNDIRSLGENVYLLYSADGTVVTDEEYTLSDGNIIIDDNSVAYDYYKADFDNESVGIKLLCECRDNVNGVAVNYADVKGIKGESVCGEPQNDIVQKFIANNEEQGDFFIQYNLNSTHINDTVTTSISVIPNDTLEYIRFNTRYHLRLSEEIYMNSLRAGEWNVIELEYNSQTKEGTVFINGAKFSSYIGAGITDNQIRICFQKNKEAVGEKYCYVDDVSFISGKYAKNPIISNEEKVGNYIKMQKLSAHNAKDKFTPKNGYTVDVRDDDGENMNLYVYSGEICVKKYIINTADVVMNISARISDKSIYIDYDGKTYKNIQMPQLMVCEYDVGGALVKINVLQSHNADGGINFVWDSVLNKKTDNIKVMLWDGEKLIPYTECISLKSK